MDFRSTKNVSAVRCKRISVTVLYQFNRIQLTGFGSKVTKTGYREKYQVDGPLERLRLRSTSARGLWERDSGIRNRAESSAIYFGVYAIGGCVGLSLDE